MIKKFRLHPLDIAAKNASFDMIEYIRKKIRDYETGIEATQQSGL